MLHSVHTDQPFTKVQYSLGVLFVFCPICNKYLVVAESCNMKHKNLNQIAHTVDHLFTKVQYSLGVAFVICRVCNKYLVVAESCNMKQKNLSQITVMILSFKIDRPEHTV